MRRLDKIWARLAGYFWLPCPVCHELFGGHEAGEWSVPTERPGMGRIVCYKRSCNAEARRLRSVAQCDEPAGHPDK